MRWLYIGGLGAPYILFTLHKHYCLREWQLFTMTDALLPMALNPVFLKMVSVRSNVYAPFWF